MIQEKITCPLCGNSAQEHNPQYGSEKRTIDCIHCGPYVLTFEAAANLDSVKRDSPRQFKLLPAELRKMKSSLQEPFLLSSYSLDHIIDNAEPYRPREQAERMILLLGKEQEEFGEYAEVDFVSHGALIGCTSSQGFFFIFEYLQSQGLAKGDFFIGTGGAASLVLTFEGWDLFEKISKGENDSRTAFMAMEFGHEILENFTENHIRPIVHAAGYRLKKLNDIEYQKAGLIDDRLRYEIRQSKFVICDLTHNNSGAYWEAGFAEGLGKPVIYTCKRSVFNERPSGTHFDTNHHLHILWEADEAGKFEAELSACIKATFLDK